MKKQLLGVNITVNPKEEILRQIEAYLIHHSSSIIHHPYIIVTPNPEQIVLAQKNREFLKILNRADVSLPDGIGIVWALKGAVSRIPGIDFMSDLVRMANKQGWTIGLIGGRNGVANEALLTLQSSYKNLKGWAIEPEETDTEKLARHIADSNTKIVFVGLGAPKQEQYIKSLPLHNRVVLMAVGGAFDMIAGTIPRAPAWMQTGGFEWVYRLIREPWRWKRQLALLQFFLLVLRMRRGK